MIPSSLPDDPGLYGLDTLLSFYIRSFNQLLNRDLEERLEAMDMQPAMRGTGKGAVILLVETHPGIRPSDIAKILVRDRPAISRVIAPLVDAGLIEQRIVANERRATGLYITEEGKKAAALAKTVVTEQADEFFSSMPREDKVELERILKDLFRVVSARG